MRTPLSSRRRRGGFSFLELVIAMGIAASLGGLLFPAFTSAKRQAQAVACTSNLRQIGMAATLYAGEHNQTFPTIEPWPDNPVYSSSAGAVTLSDAFGSYGLTGKVLQCPSDLTGPDYYKKEGSSYEWVPLANGQKLQAPTLNFGAMSVQVPLTRLFLAFDYASVHGGTYNVLFGDGHVGKAN